MMHWMFGDYGMHFGPGMGFFMLFFWFLVILGVILLLRALLLSGRKGGGAACGTDSAEEVLKKRYARGEIGEDEFRRMKQELRS